MFCLETLEDAVTWTVFRRLQLGAQFGAALRAAGIVPAGEVEPAMLLWAAAVPQGDVRAQSLRSDLATASKTLREDPLKRTETDVALDFGPEGVVLIEGKHRSANEVNVDASWGRYACEGCFSDVTLVRQSGMYELARN